MSLISRIIDPRQSSLEETPTGGLPVAKVNDFSGIHLFPTGDSAELVHDLRQPLTAIMGYLSMIQTDLGKTRFADERTIENLQTAMSEVEYMAGFLRLMMPHQKMDVRTYDLSSVLLNQELILKRAVISRGQELKIQTRPLLYVSIDELLVVRALRNLVKNASEAMGPEGNVNVGAREIAISSPAYGVSQGPYVELAVCDNGPGMDKKTIDRLFEPFYTTKVKGNGLGLLSVLATMHKHKGALEVRSAPGEGTQIMLYFPRQEYGARQASAEPNRFSTS